MNIPPLRGSFLPQIWRTQAWLVPGLALTPCKIGAYTFCFGNAEKGASVLRIMGLDVGEVRIGVAVSDETELIAQGVSTLHRVGWKKDLPSLLQTIREYQVGRIVVGNPISMDGTASRQANLIQDFVRRLKEATPVEVTLWDERLSSLAAEKVLIEGGMQRGKRKQVIDKLAAVIILQNYLDHQNARRARPEGP